MLAVSDSTLRNLDVAVKPSNLSKHPIGWKAPNSASSGRATKAAVRRFSRVANLQSSATLRLAASGGSRYNSLMLSVSQTVRVKVLFFGRLKDAVGQAEESLDISDASTIEQLFALYVQRIPELAKYRSSLVASRNQEFAAWDSALYSGDEVAFLPPVSGG